MITSECIGFQLLMVQKTTRTVFWYCHLSIYIVFLMLILIIYKFKFNSVWRRYS